MFALPTIPAKIEARRGRPSNKKGKTGKPASDETKAKMSAAHSGESNHFFGRKHSEATRNIMGEPCRGKTWKLVDGKRVWQDK